MPFSVHIGYAPALDIMHLIIPPAHSFIMKCTSYHPIDQRVLFSWNSEVLDGVACYTTLVILGRWQYKTKHPTPHKMNCE